MARTLSTQQIAQGLRDAGFPEQVIPTMTAVTMAESGGNPYAHNPNAGTGDNSYGLLQINMLGGMGPERRQWFGLNSDDQLFDPSTNFRAAKKIYDSQGIGAWGAYTNGSYKKYLGQDSAGGALVQPGDAGPNASVDLSSGALNNNPGGGGLPPTRKGTLQERMGTAAVGASDDMMAGLLGGAKETGTQRLAGALGTGVFSTAVSQPVGSRMAGDQTPPSAAKISAPANGDTSTFVTGNTGASTGPHLDFRVYSKSKGGYVNNPGDYTHLVTTGDGTSVAQAFQMTSPYGMRNHPTKGGQRLHEGVDYATPEGTQLKVQGTLVDRKSEPGGGGNYNIYQHPTDPDLELVLMHGA